MTEDNHSTTTIVREVFKNFFDHKKIKPNGKIPRNFSNLYSPNGCGICKNCLVSDCGNCVNCQSMKKFGGHGSQKQCKNRPKCLSRPEDFTYCVETDGKEEIRRKKRQFSKTLLHTVEWIKKGYKDKVHSRQYYTSARVGNMYLNQGDNVMLAAREPNEPLSIAHVEYMFQDTDGDPSFHAHLYCRGTDSILGETADPRELFIVDDCLDCPLGCIIQIAKVEFMSKPKNWHLIGGKQKLPPNQPDDGKTFHFSKKYEYEQSRFVDYLDEPNVACMSCKWQDDIAEFNRPVCSKDYFLQERVIQWRNEKYFVGTAVFLEPGRYKTNESKNYNEQLTTVTDDEYLMMKTPHDDDVFVSGADLKILYPELYRKEKTSNKDLNNNKGEAINNRNVPEPYTIGVIEDIKSNKEILTVKVRLFYRPEDRKCREAGDIHLLYWSEETKWVPFQAIVKGKCYVAFSQNIGNVEEWVKQGPFRFYFEHAYNIKDDSTRCVPPQARTLGKVGRIQAGYFCDTIPIWPELERKLLCMDIYAGCGGLSDGLERSGVARVAWAIEKENAPAVAFRLNHPMCKVFENDCKMILNCLLEGKGNEFGLPDKGEIELIVGGPPCQGFSQMNRYVHGNSSVMKNAELETFLGFVDYFRPKYFIFENVKNFVMFKSNILLKLTLRCLLAIGYQVAFGILQAGNFGLPQTRRRFFIVGAAAGLELPKLPDPVHTFVKYGLSLNVDGFLYDVGETLSGAHGSLPYRGMTVRDAIVDLPFTHNGSDADTMQYENATSVSSYVKMLREYCSNSDIITEHVCKRMGALAIKRIELIPCRPGADWRDLPNFELELEDGSSTVVLEYPYSSTNQNRKDPPKGVCKCATGRDCDKRKSQYKTHSLIPWSCTHTADRNNHWAGVYGRLDWDGVFSTTTTNPEPSSTQGKVLHPDQHRIISVRECARSQGFHDEFKFFGNTADKYRQVGNAVPPLLALAIGREIVKTHSDCTKSVKL